MGFDFVGRRKIWFSLSGLLIVVGLGALALKGLSFGIEFTGGTIFDLRFGLKPEVGQVRDVLEPFGLEKSVIQRIGEKEILIRGPSVSKDVQKQAVSKLDEWFDLEETVYIQSVGPGWGSNVTRAALIALSLSLAGLLVYISWRFEFKMATSAIVALFHDILVSVGIYVLLGREVNPNTVAAFLTIMGYSLYDSIVVFHRVQENTARIGKRTYGEMVNNSVNQVLVRSINTSLTTLIPVISLLAFGGET
ncbi:MAG: protein translocase subunit SecF, partial [Terriglobia bacterium]